MNTFLRNNISYTKPHMLRFITESSLSTYTFIRVSHPYNTHIYFFWRDSPPPHQWARASSFARYLDHTQRRTTVGRTPLDEWSARRRDLYITTHNTHNRQTSTPPVEIEPTISAGERPQTYSLVRAVTGSGITCRISATNPNTCVIMCCILHTSSETWHFRIFKLTTCLNWILKSEFWSYNW